MKVAVVGSRGIRRINLEKYLPKECDEIVSGGAIGVDTLARNYAIANGLKLKEFLPEYEKYGRRAPILRNFLIVDYADEVIAFWDGESRGTFSVIDYCYKKGKKIRVVRKDEF